jgi:hypothetical protein
MRNLVPNIVEHNKVFADAMEQLFKSMRYGLATCKRKTSLDQAVMRKHIVDWQLNEDDDALTTASIQYTTWLPVLYEVNTSGSIGSNMSTTAVAPAGISLGYNYPGGTQNIIDVNTGGCLTRINLNPTITIDNSTSGGGANYTHVQSVAAVTWTINHGLGFIPNVFVLDGNGVELIGTVDSATATTLVISFSQAVSGTAYLT